MALAGFRMNHQLTPNNYGGAASARENRLGETQANAASVLESSTF
jgi:hypothetical protein